MSPPPGTTIALDGAVIRIVELLLAVQNMKLKNQVPTPEQEAESQGLRAKVPAGVLEKFDRLVGHGKKAVAIVRSGVCSECHLQLSSGTLADLVYTTEIHHCDNCGRFLYLPLDEPPGLTNGASVAAAVARPMARSSRKQAPAHVP